MGTYLPAGIFAIVRFRLLQGAVPFDDRTDMAWRISLALIILWRHSFATDLQRLVEWRREDCGKYKILRSLSFCFSESKNLHEADCGMPVLL